MKIFRETFTKVADFDELKVCATIDVEINGVRKTVKASAFKRDLDENNKLVGCCSVGNYEFRTKEFTLLSIFSDNETSIRAVATRGSYHTVKVADIFFA